MYKPVPKDFAEVLKEQGYTYSDYCNWPDQERWEIIDGQAYNMTPAPNINHQRVSRKFVNNLENHILASKTKCELFFAPTDVVFDAYNVVQPDIFMVCDPTKIGEKNVQGAPDIIFEIRSPSTALKDRTAKFDLYQKHGVKTYIIVLPAEGFLEVYRLENGQYGKPEVLGRDQTLELEPPTISLPLDTIFEEIQVEIKNKPPSS